MGGNVTIPAGITEKQWKKLDPIVQNACLKDANIAAGLAKALSRGLTLSQINEYYKNDAVVKGLSVERNADDGRVKPPAEMTAELIQDKNSREMVTTQWQTYFRDRYTNNREEAVHDMARLLSHKQVKQLQNTYVDLWKQQDSSDPAAKNASLRLKMKYINEHPDKQKKFDELVQAYVKKYEKKLNDQQLINDFYNEFAPRTLTEGQKTNTESHKVDQITMDDLKALAQARALNDEHLFEPEEIGMACEDLAINAIVDRNINRGIVEYNEYQAEIDQIINENRTNPEIQKLTQKYNAQKADLTANLNEAQKRGNKTKELEYQQKLKELKAQYNTDCDAALPKEAREKVKKLAEKADKAIQKANDKETEYFNKNIDKLIEVAAEAQVSIEMHKNTFEQASKNPKKFAELDPEVQVLIQQNPALFCEEITDPNDTRAADVTVGEGSKQKKYVFNYETYQKKMLEFARAGKTAGKEQTNIDGDDYYCDIPEGEQAYWGIAFGGLGDNKEAKRNVIKKAMEAAGITTEADHTTRQRIAHVLKHAGIGALSGAGALLVSDAVATLKQVPFTEKIFELASLTKMIPYTHHVKFDQTYYLNGNNATYSATGNWTFDHTVTSHHSVTDYENGILAGHREWDENIPVHGEGTITISGNDGHWETEHHVIEEWDEKGEVKNPDADRELYEQTGTKQHKFRPKFSSLGAYGIAAATGAVTGAIEGLLTMNKVKDKGLRRDAEAMRLVSQKEIRKPEPPAPPKPPAPPTPPPPPAKPTADIKSKTVPGKDKIEDVVYEQSYFKSEKKRSYWYDYANAYDFDPKKVSVAQVYKAIQKRNGYSASNPNPPILDPNKEETGVMLPIKLEVAPGVFIERKATYTIPKHPIPTREVGNGKGQASGGKASVTKGKDSKTYNVYKDGKLVKSGVDEQTAKDEYKKITGKDHSGPIQEET